MIAINSLKAYEAVSFVENGGAWRHQKIDNETYVLGGYATKEAAASAICALIADKMCAAVLEGKNVLMLNRVGPTVQQTEQGWSGRWRGAFVTYVEPTFTWEKTETFGVI